jgi:membrane protein
MIDGMDSAYAPATWPASLNALWRSLRAWPWFDTLRTLRARFREDHLGLTAGSLTFTTLVGLVPLMTVMLALFTAFPMFARFQAALEQYLLQSLVPEGIARPVLSALTQFAAKASQVGTVGLVVLLVAALALVFTIDRTLNAIWRVRKRRPLAQRVLVYWAGLTLGPLLLGVSLSVTSYAISASRGLVDAMPGGVSLTHAWAGALFATVGFELAKKGLAWYVGLVPTYSVVYGAFATLPILLLWIYLSWVVVLLGAVIAAYAPSLAMRVARLPDTPGYRFALAVVLLRELTRVRGAGQKGLSLSALAGAVHVDPLQVEPVLEALMSLDWVARLDEDGARRHVLLADPQATLAAPLVDTLLLEPTASTQAFRARAAFATMRLAELF